MWTYKNNKIFIKTFKKLYLVIGNGNLPLPSLIDDTNLNAHTVVYVGSKQGCCLFIDNYIVSKKKITQNDLIFQSDSQVVMKNGYFDNTYTLQIVSLEQELKYIDAIHYNLSSFCIQIEDLSERKIYRVHRSYRFYFNQLCKKWKYFLEEDVDLFETIIYIVCSVILIALFLENIVNTNLN